MPGLLLRAAPPGAVEAAVQTRALAVLRDALSDAAIDEAFWPAMHAAEAFSRSGRGDEVRAVLASRLAAESDDQRRCGLARELVRAGQLPAARVLLSILADTSSNGRVHAAESLFKVAELGDGRLLRAAFESDDEHLRLMAAGALVRGGHPTAGQTIAAALTSSDPRSRMIAPWLLGQVGSEADVSALEQFARAAHDPLERSQAEHALARLGSAAARGQLLSNLAAADPRIRVYAAEAALALAADEPLSAALIARLDDPDRDVRIRAADALLALAADPAAAAAAGPAADEDVSQRLFAASAEHPRWSEGSLAVLADGTLLLAMTRFIGGGADASAADIVARRSHDGGLTWDAATVLQENVGQRNVMSVTLRRLRPDAVCDGPLGLFYLVKNGDTDLQVMLRVSEDEAVTFGPPRPVTARSGYHVLNNDRVLVLSGGRLLCPVSWTADQARENHYRALCFLSDDEGRTWRAGRGEVDLPRRGAMEPEVIEQPDGHVMMIVRSQLGRIYAARSRDGGDTFDQPVPWGPPAPEAPATLRRVPATGDLLLVWNHHTDPNESHFGRRTPLTAAVSSDGGTHWRHLRNLESNPAETYAYTSLEFHRGRVLASYYVRDESSGWISARFRSLPVGWFYKSSETYVAD